MLDDKARPLLGLCLRILKIPDSRQFQSNPMDSDEITFGHFRLDLRRRELSRDGETIRLHVRAIGILCELAAAKGEVVSKDELISRLWPGRIVEEGNLQVHISALRKALGGHGEGHSYIVTVPGSGYRLATGWPSARLDEPSFPTSLPLPDKPSIAVLPFENMSGDPDQEYFADGMVEEIITALSRFKWLFVIARNSSFTFKGKAVDIKEVGRRLGVRYVLEGSVRKAAGKVRISGQLIDVVTGAHIWADRFERDLTDVFALQDEVTVAVVSAVQPKLVETEIEMATRRPPENLTAYDLWLRARQKYALRSRVGMAETLQLAHRALDLDPRSVAAAPLAASAHLDNVALGFSDDPQFDRNEAVRLVRLALSLDENNAFALATAGYLAAYLHGDHESAIDFADRAIASNPNSAIAWRARALVYRYAGQHEEAIRSSERAIRLSPLDPFLHTALDTMGFALIELRRFDEAVTVSKKALRQNPSDSPALRALAAALGHLGRDAEAHEAATRLLEVDPAFTISGWLARGAQSNATLLIEGLRKAGLPE
jgi:TolB-like protein/Flp pilus assembly protein TadD